MLEKPATAYPPPIPGRHSSKWSLVWVAPAALVGVIVFGISGAWSAGCRAYVVPSSSMAPTIQEGDHIVADTTYYISRRPKDSEIILFKRGPTIFIKRVVASGGEVVEGKNGEVFVNGRMLKEPYIEHSGSPEGWMNNFGPAKIRADEYFVIGDNRDFSLDSRSSDYGMVSFDSIAGKPLFVLFGKQSGRAGKAIR